jgi:membrane protease YdiL (CAAX protease family)
MIKTINQKYILITAIFTLTIISSLTIPIAYIQLFATPVNLIISYLLLRNEITYDSEALNNENTNLAFSAFFICIIVQAIFNLVGIRIFVPNQQITITTLIPIVPIYTVLFAPILEELIFRKIIFGWLQRDNEKFSILAATISSLLFASSHMNLPYILGYFAVGFVLCYFYFKTRRLHVVILAHMFLNFFALFSQSIYMTFGG